MSRTVLSMMSCLGDADDTAGCLMVRNSEGQSVFGEGEEDQAVARRLMGTFASN